MSDRLRAFLLPVLTPSLSPDTPPSRAGSLLQFDRGQNTDAACAENLL